MYFLYSLALALWAILGAPFWLFQMLRHGKYREGLSERLGRVPTHLRAPSAPADTIWVHAVSVGEVIAISSLVSKLRQRLPEARIVVSTTTATGQLLARQRFGKESVFYFPLDFRFAIAPYLETLHPQLIIIAETEIWPNFLRLAHKSGAKVAMVNARISDHSFPGYRRVRRWLAHILGDIDLILAQTDEDRWRLLALGAPESRVHLAGNLKYDISPPDPPPILNRLRAALERVKAGPILVCGSTADDEEALLLRAFELVLARYPCAVMILAPRHPERFDHVADLISSLGIRFWRRSEWDDDRWLAGGVFLLDSIGELASMYSLATLAFVGGSLSRRGGHNILEAAQHGVPILVGPHTENFRDMVSLFRDAGALKVVGPAELPLVTMELLADDTEREQMGARARETLRSQAGATERMLTALERLLRPAEHTEMPLAATTHMTADRDQSQ